MFGNCYAGQTVLVTGHTGFKGSWLGWWLLRLRARVVGYALQPPTTPSLFGTSGLAHHLDHIEGDVRDAARLRAVVRETRPDFVFHLAAQPLVRASYEEPRATFETNVLGTLALLDALRASGHPCTVIVVSTDKCYENREWAWGYRETDALGGHDPYSASKAAMEIALASYRRSFFPPERVPTHGVRLASARAGNVIGGGDWATDRIVPDAMRALASGEPLRVRNPRSVRPWQHVLEPLSGYLWLGARLAEPGGERLADGWNFGPADATRPVGALADAIIEAWGAGEWRTPDDDTSAPHEAGLLALSIDKARHSLGWQPVWTFEQTVKATVAWYRAALAAESDVMVRDLCEGDLARYEADAAAKELAWTR